MQSTDHIYSSAFPLCTLPQTRSHNFFIETTEYQGRIFNIFRKANIKNNRTVERTENINLKEQDRACTFQQRKQSHSIQRV